MSATITVALYGEAHGLVIAVIPRQDPYVMGTSLVVGDARRISADGEPELWRAWLWPLAGGNGRVTQSCEAVDAISVARLRARLQKRTDGKGPWWSVPDGRCLEVLEHGGEETRCETAAVVSHDVHRADGGLEWMRPGDFELAMEAEG